jgi:hypothetical protein
MCTSDGEGVVGVFDALDADLDRALELSFDALNVPELLNMLERWEPRNRVGQAGRPGMCNPDDQMPVWMAPRDRRRSPAMGVVTPNGTTTR